jgi:hypothetical protein
MKQIPHTTEHPPPPPPPRQSAPEKSKRLRLYMHPADPELRR